MNAVPAPITCLLQSWQAGDSAAEQELIAVVYERLRKLAYAHLARGAHAQTLCATALIHEAYLKIASADVAWQNRSHFFAIASIAMRRVLVDAARARGRRRRGSNAARTELEEHMLSVAPPTADILDLDRSLNRLAQIDPRKVRIVELTVFAGLSATEAGECLQLSEPTVRRELRLARAWIKCDLQSVSSGSPPLPA